MLSRKNIPNGLQRAVYGGKPHNVPRALQSVNMKNTSEERGGGGGGGLWGRARLGMQTCGQYVPHSAISAPDTSASASLERRCFCWGD